MRYIVIVLLCFIVSCKQNKKLNNPSESNTDTGLVFAFIDTIKKHESANDYLARYDSPLSIFYKGISNNTNFAVFALTDSFVAFYQKVNSKWKVVDTSVFKLYAHEIKQVDLNGDKFKDIRISCHCSGSAGNDETIVYIYNPHLKSFVRNEYYDLYNVRYDIKRHRVQSWYYAGVTHPQEKSIYKVTGDSLTLDSSITYYPPDNFQIDSARVEISSPIGDKIIHGNTDEMWKVFEKSFWDSTNE